MSNEDEWDDMWHTGLRARLGTSFPKRCTTCGRIFETAEEYFTETLDIGEDDKGLKPFVDDDTTVIIEAFRNCPCGSTLMEMFENPEDNTLEKIAHRKREKELANSKRMPKPPAAKPSRASAEDLMMSLESGFSDLDLMHVEEKWGDEWYRGLRPKGESAFPKKCQNCGRVYETSKDFFFETANIKADETGLRACTDSDDSVVIEAFRNCVCGSTLMDNFSDRRDMSPGGRERRDKFIKMQNYLVRMGLSADTATAELLKVARGGESKILAKIKPPG